MTPPSSDFIVKVLSGKGAGVLWIYHNLIVILRLEVIYEERFSHVLPKSERYTPFLVTGLDNRVDHIWVAGCARQANTAHVVTGQTG